ncbi:cell wall hydrolase [Sphingosinicella sp. CPCC 101087]|uniref:cell wall hydrolase n=1 Tax=Sphingosinicella sp. CPCC 101087 TaxID=2497754 RepID=UPI00101D2B5D|nr:cell wall hydrolase [Sphingosinicella sp. CPCC 101087]
MIRTVRAAGIAVAASALAAAAVFSNPLQADAGNIAPQASHYLDHAGASAEVVDIGLNGPESETGAESERNERFGQFADHMIALADQALPRPRTLGELVSSHQAVDTANREQDCLANAVYFEARGEPLEGQLAVAEVVLNRARSGRYPRTICEVVTQPWQFSFVRRGIIPRANRRSESWRRAVAVARIAEAGASRLLPDDVLWYHADYVSPSWGRRLDRNTKIGLHIFYS